MVDVLMDNTAHTHAQAQRRTLVDKAAADARREELCNRQREIAFTGSPDDGGPCYVLTRNVRTGTDKPLRVFFCVTPDGDRVWLTITLTKCRNSATQAGTHTDKAYPNAQQREMLAALGLKHGLQRKAQKSKPLSECQERRMQRKPEDWAGQRRKMP